MNRQLKIIATACFLTLAWIGAATAQQANNYWCNSATVPCPPPAWTPSSAANPLPITGTVTATAGNAVGITPTDHTITSASGASQQIMAANATRHSMTIENTSTTSNCGVNPTGGTAAIGGAGTITLAPLGSYSPRIPTLSAVTIICTAGQPIYGDDS
jgi:hypothetical protein